jgi:phosphoenolpyruvate carboxykinase (GTP)
VAGQVDAVRTAIGDLPTPASLDVDGLDIRDEDLATLLAVDAEGWKGAISQIEQHFSQFGDSLPGELNEQLGKLAAAL